MQLQAKNVCFSYPCGKKVLEDVDFSISSGEIVGLIAPSGAGKTTLSKILAGYVKPEQGEVFIDGQPLKEYMKSNNRQFCNPQCRLMNPIQLIFQHPEKAINPKWKMRRVLDEASEQGVDFDAENFRELMELVGIKKEWLNRYSFELSGGELQRFCVLRALLAEPEFIIADEMTTMLDAITQAQIWAVVLDYAKKNNAGLVVISHDSHLINNICQRISSFRG